MTDVLHRGLLFLQAEPDIAKIRETEPTGGWAVFVLLLVVFVLPFVLGTLIAKALKLRDLSAKIGLCLFAVTAALAPFGWQLYLGNNVRDAVPLGIDLAGGTNMIFEVDVQKARQEFQKEIDSQLMDQMVASIARRINPSGTEEVTVRRVGTNRVEVIIPGADQDLVEQKKREITRLGSLEFAILANRRDHQQIIRQAQELPTDQNDLRVGGRVAASWRSVAPGKEVSPGPDSETVSREVTREIAGEKIPVRQILVVLEPETRRVTGRYLIRASQEMDENAQPAVGFRLNTRGGYLFQQLTTRYRPNKEGFERHLAILLDGMIHSAPTIRSPINTQGQITGRFTQPEVDELVNVLNAGALEVPLIPDPISEFSISPLLGVDVQKKGMLAIGLSLGAVFLFMLVYYRFAGIVADLCLLMNLVLVVGTMAFIEAAFTLPGLAGLVLTIGMAVDANVLIFERIREEVQRGSSLRVSIHNGFSKALSPIIDANVTTLITAVILYMIGSDQVRGFAVTLFIGLIMSMFSAIYFGRLMFDMAERKRWIRHLKMFSLVGATRIDFLNKGMIAAVVSFVVIAAGMGSLFARGQDNLDIDFTGGTMVTFEFVEPHEVDEVRQHLQKEFGSGISLERLVLTGQKEGHRFRVRTTLARPQEVEEGINRAFEGTDLHLRRVQMTVGEIRPLPEDAAGEEESAFTGGHLVPLTFTSGITEGRVAAEVAEQLEELTGAEDVDELIRVRGTREEEQPLESGTGAGGARRYTELELLATPDVREADLRTALERAAERRATQPVFEEVTTFAGSVASETQTDAILALLASLAAIVGYIWFRFERITFGLAAMAALVHDVLVVLGSVALAAYLSQTVFGRALLLEDFKINLPMIAAFLTIIGYSLNDTIVIFDRIREIRGKNPTVTYDMINLSVNQTLARTVLTSLTTLLVVGILYAIGGEGIHGFAFCLIIGILTGTYSTIYIANPVLLWLTTRTAKAAA